MEQGQVEVAGLPQARRCLHPQHTTCRTSRTQQPPGHHSHQPSHQHQHCNSHHGQNPLQQRLQWRGQRSRWPQRLLRRLQQQLLLSRPPSKRAQGRAVHTLAQAVHTLRQAVHILGQAMDQLQVMGPQHLPASTLPHILHHTCPSQQRWTRICLQMMILGVGLGVGTGCPSTCLAEEERGRAVHRAQPPSFYKAQARALGMLRLHLVS